MWTSDGYFFRGDMSEAQATMLFGALCLMMALTLFFGAGVLERVNRPAAQKLLKTSPDFEWARARLSAFIFGVAALLIILSGLVGASFTAMFRDQWWVGVFILIGALALILWRRKVAKLLSRPVPQIYGRLGEEERRDVTSRVLFGVGLFAAWGGLLTALQR